MAKIFTESAAMNVLNLITKDFAQDTANTYNKQNSSATHLNNQLISVNTLEGLNNILPSVQSHNKQVEYSGNDELSLNFESKLKAYKANKLAYENAHKYQDMVFASNYDEVAKEMLSGGWEKYTETMLEIYSLKDAMAQGKAFKFRYKPQGKYNQLSLDKSLVKMEEIALSALEVLDDYEGDFDVINPDGTIDEESRILFDKLKLDIALGNTSEVKSTMNRGVSSSISRYNQSIRQYITFSKMGMKKFSNKTVGEAASEMGELEDEILKLAGLQGQGSNDYIDPAFIIDMTRQGLENAEKANRRHKAYTGVLYDDNPIYERLKISENDFGDMGVKTEGATIDDLNKDAGKDLLLKEILDTSELKKDEPEDITPLEEVPEPLISKTSPSVGSLEYKKAQQTPPAVQELTEEEKIRQEYNTYVVDTKQRDLSYDEFKKVYTAQKDFDEKEYEYQGYQRESMGEKPLLLKDEYKFVNTYKLQEIPSIGYFLSEDGNRLSIDEIVSKDHELLKEKLNQIIKDKRFYRGVAYGQRPGMRLRKDIGVINTLIKQYKSGKKKDVGGYNLEERIMKSYNRIMDNFMGYARDLGKDEIQRTRGLLN